MGKTRAITTLPDYAAIGEQVNIKVLVENMSSEPTLVNTQVHIGYDDYSQELYSEWVELPANHSASFPFSFTMPDVTPSSDYPQRCVHVATYIWVSTWVSTGWEWDAGAEEWYETGYWDAKLDSFGVGNSTVQVMPPSPQFTVEVINAPADARTWHFLFVSGISWIQSTELNIGAIWYSAALAPNEEKSFEMFVYHGWQIVDSGWYTDSTKWTGKVTLETGKHYVFDCQKGAFITEGPQPLDAELTIAYVWLDNLWKQILASNTWPANATLETRWGIKNTGTEGAWFTIKFMGKTKAGFSLSPGEEKSVELTVNTPSPGVGNYTLEILARGELLKDYQFEVITVTEEKPEFISGETKTAMVRTTASPGDLTLDAELCLVQNEEIKASSGAMPFVSVGKPQTIPLSIVMPELGEYAVRFYIMAEDTLVYAYAFGSIEVSAA